MKRFVITAVSTLLLGVVASGSAVAQSGRTTANTDPTGELWKAYTAQQLGVGTGGLPPLKLERYKYDKSDLEFSVKIPFDLVLPKAWADNLEAKVSYSALSGFKGKLKVFNFIQIDSGGKFSAQVPNAKAKYNVRLGELGWDAKVDLNDGRFKNSFGLDLWIFSAKIVVTSRPVFVLRDPPPPYNEREGRRQYEAAREKFRLQRMSVSEKINELDRLLLDPRLAGAPRSGKAGARSTFGLWARLGRRLPPDPFPGKAYKDPFAKGQRPWGQWPAAKGKTTTPKISSVRRSAPGLSGRSFPSLAPRSKLDKGKRKLNPRGPYTVNYYRIGDYPKGGELNGVYSTLSMAMEAVARLKRWAAEIAANSPTSSWRIAVIEVVDDSTGKKLTFRLNNGNPGDKNPPATTNTSRGGARGDLFWPPRTGISLNAGKRSGPASSRVLQKPKKQGQRQRFSYLTAPKKTVRTFGRNDKRPGRGAPVQRRYDWLQGNRNGKSSPPKVASTNKSPGAYSWNKYGKGFVDPFRVKQDRVTGKSSGYPKPTGTTAAKSGLFPGRWSGSPVRKPSRPGVSLAGSPYRFQGTSSRPGSGTASKPSWSYSGSFYPRSGSARVPYKFGNGTASLPSKPRGNAVKPFITYGRYSGTPGKSAGVSSASRSSRPRSGGYSSYSGSTGSYRQRSGSLSAPRYTPRGGGNARPVNDRRAQAQRQLLAEARNLNARIRAHNANKPNRYSRAAVNAYNARGRALNAEMARLRARAQNLR